MRFNENEELTQLQIVHYKLVNFILSGIIIGSAIYAVYKLGSLFFG